MFNFGKSLSRLAWLALACLACHALAWLASLRPGPTPAWTTATTVVRSAAPATEGVHVAVAVGKTRVGSGGGEVSQAEARQAKQAPSTDSRGLEEAGGAQARGGHGAHREAAGKRSTQGERREGVQSKGSGGTCKRQSQPGLTVTVTVAITVTQTQILT